MKRKFEIEVTMQDVERAKRKLGSNYGNVAFHASCCPVTEAFHRHRHMGGNVTASHVFLTTSAETEPGPFRNYRHDGINIVKAFDSPGKTLMPKLPAMVTVTRTN